MAEATVPPLDPAVSLSPIEATSDGHTQPFAMGAFESQTQVVALEVEKVIRVWVFARKREVNDIRFCNHLDQAADELMRTIRSILEED